MKCSIPSSRSLGLTFLPAIVLLACAPPGEGADSATSTQDPTRSSDAGEVAEVFAALTTVPSGVLCVKVTANIGTTTINPPAFTVVPGNGSATLSLGQLPLGAATISGSAFNAACTSVTSSSTPSWIAAPVSATLSAGTVSVVPLVFQRNNAVTVSANFLDNFGEIAPAGDGTYARMRDGTVKQWGNCINGVFATPIGLSGVTGTTQIAGGWNRAGSEFLCARVTDGSIGCIGKIFSGLSFSTFSTVLNYAGQPALDVAAGGNFACGILDHNSIYCWGANDAGQLGNGTTTSSTFPVSSTGWGARIFAGEGHACSIGGDGLARCWGYNGFGQIGDGTTTNRLTSTVVSVLTGVVDMGLGRSHSCAVRGDGMLYCWGDNSSGQLGDGTTTMRSTPVAVQGITDAVQVVAGEVHTCVRRTGGAVACWGTGVALGDGANVTRSVPQAVPGLSGVVALRSHLGNHTCVEMSDHTVKCWGFNAHGQIGDGTYLPATKPSPVLLQ